jgi:hypothetical protein
MGEFDRTSGRVVGQVVLVGVTSWATQDCVPGGDATQAGAVAVSQPDVRKWINSLIGTIGVKQPGDLTPIPFPRAGDAATSG